uniref:Carboxylic ester hydrolase n=1 Tax=Plectus sambesii TaxID=2011161 RepID=A0A914XKG6_9BILA
MAVLYAILFALCANLLQQAKCVNVSTTKGVVAGYRADFGTDMSQTYYGSADVFLGIPYAAPPVGPLRFKPPQSSTAWNSLLNATSFESYKQCPQLNSFISNPQGSSEDCLYLNVFSPNVSSLVKYPVMVWIHGGALVSGNAQFFGIKGTVRNLVSRGVVVVTLQYRLGLLGFFTTGTSDFPANLGMLDQVMALQWVKQEISAFGGDPSQVTIFGESAGGASVSAHTYSPLSKGLFQKAIMQSGVTLMELDGTHGYT